MYGGNPNYKPGAKGNAKKLVDIPVEKFDDYVPRTPGSNPKKGKLVSAFPVGEKRCRVRKAAFDEQTKLLYIVLSEAKSEDVYATIQIYKLNSDTKVFEKLNDQVLSAGRIGGIVVLGNDKVVVTLMQKDPKKITAMVLKPKWEAFIYNSQLANAVSLNTNSVPQPAQSDSWCMCEGSPDGTCFYMACPQFGKLHEYKKSVGPGNNKCSREIKCMNLQNLESMAFFGDKKTFVSIHRDKAYRWADRMNYHAFIHTIQEGVAKKVTKVDNVDQGLVAVFDMTKLLLSRRKPLWDSVDFQVVDYKKPEELKIIDSKMKLIRPLAMVGRERVLVCLDDTKDTQFGLLQLSF